MRGTAEMGDTGLEPVGGGSGWHEMARLLTLRAMRFA